MEYEIAKGKNLPLEDRILILEKYLSEEMDDKWAFELAKLFHKAGQKEKCISQCDTVILWFSEGKYVERAMELKMLYAPLTPEQQTMYNARWKTKTIPTEQINEIHVKELDVQNVYNTMNIQEAIKKSVSKLFDESEETEEESAPKDSFLSHTINDININDKEKKYHTVPLNPMFEVETGGQIQMSIEEEVLDSQIEGQMTIEELLEAYERREALEQAQQDELEMVAEALVSYEMEVAVSQEELEDEEEFQEELEVQEELELPEETELPDELEMPEEPEMPDEIELPEEQEAPDELELPNEPELPGELELSEESELSEENAEEMTEEENEENTSEETTVVEKQGLSNEEIKDTIKNFVNKFSGVKGLDRQVLMTLQETTVNGNNKIIVMGEARSGKTSLAIDLIKTINRVKQQRGRKIAKINAIILNDKDMETYYAKLEGMDMVIEKASAMNQDVLGKFMERVEQDEENKLIVFEDDKASAERLIEENEKVRDLFKVSLVVRQNTVKDWAKVATNYAKDKGYEIDEMGMLGLHAAIDGLYAVTAVIQKVHIELLIDKAISRSINRGFGRFLKLVGKEREKVLKEGDFSN